jgi:hypothetical protein
MVSVKYGTTDWIPRVDREDQSVATCKLMNIVEHSDLDPVRHPVIGQLGFPGWQIRLWPHAN